MEHAHTHGGSPLQCLLFLCGAAACIALQRALQHNSLICVFTTVAQIIASSLRSMSKMISDGNEAHNTMCGEFLRHLRRLLVYGVDVAAITKASASPQRPVIAPSVPPPTPTTASSSTQPPLPPTAVAGAARALHQPSRGHGRSGVASPRAPFHTFDSSDTSDQDDSQGHTSRRFGSLCLSIIRVCVCVCVLVLYVWVWVCFLWPH